MDEKPTLGELARGIAIQVVAAALLCAWVASWWLGTDSFLQGSHPVVIIFLHACAAYQVAKIGWIIFWWRHPMPIPTADNHQKSSPR